MSAYNEVPEWWYFLLLLVAIGLGLIAILAFPTHTTVGAEFMGLALCVVFVIPIGIIYSVTNIEVTLNVLVSRDTPLSSIASDTLPYRPSSSEVPSSPERPSP